MLKMDIKGVRAYPIEKEVLTEKRIGLEIAFTFSSEWEHLSKVAVFEGAKTSDVLLENDVCYVPPSALSEAGPSLRVGVYGVNAAGDIKIPTVWANFGQIQPAATPSGIYDEDPTPTLVEQILSAATAASEAAATAADIAADIEARADSGEFDGYSPTVAVEDITGGHRVTITDEDGDHVFDVMDGQNGQDGAAATITVGSTTTGAAGTNASVTNSGTSSAAVLNFTIPKGDAGQDGANGQDGDDGYSPTVVVTDITGGHRVTITDANGDHTFDVMDGSAGTMDYSDLSNKPSINSVPLNGNKSLSDLGITSPTPEFYTVFYGATTVEQIFSALQNSQIPVVRYNDRIYILHTGAFPAIPLPSLDSYVFTTVGDNKKIYWLQAKLTLNGTSWTNGSISLAEISDIPSDASDVGAIAAPASPSADDVLTYSSGSWVAAAPAHQIPSGGNAGECLSKNSASDYDLRWRTINDWTPAGLMRTSGGTAAKVSEWSFWSDTQYPSWLLVTVGSSNTYAGAITLKVNGKGPYPIYINGAASSSSNYTLPAGSYFVYFDGSKFDFRTDGKIPGDITGHASGDIAAPASPTTGDFLCWNGSAWTATSLSAWQGGNY